MSTTELADILVLISKYSGLPGIVFFSIFLRSKKGNARIVFLVLLASLIADIAISYYVENIRPNSYGIGTTWVIVDYFLLTWLFLRLIPHRKKIIYLFLVVFTVGALISAGFFYSFTESNTFIRSYPSAVFTFLSIITFIEVLKESPTTKLLTYPIFWIITAIFLFNSVTLLKNLFQQYLVFDLQITMDLYIYVYVFSISFNIIKNLFFFYAFILVKKGNPDYIFPPKTVTS